MNGFIPGGGKAFERFGSVDDLLHLRFDPGEVFFADGCRQIKVVVEAIAGGGSEGQSGAGEQSHDRSGHHVSTAVAHDTEGFGVAFGDQFQRDRAVGCEFREWPHGIDNGAVDAGGDGGFGKTFTDTSGDVQCSGGIRVFDHIAIGELNLNHGSVLRCLKTGLGCRRLLQKVAGASLTREP